MIALSRWIELKTAHDRCMAYNPATDCEGARAGHSQPMLLLADEVIE